MIPPFASRQREIEKMRYLQTSALVAVAMGLSLCVPALHAQITGQVDGDIHHRFIVGNATLPPGHYVFQMMSDTDQNLMVVTSKDGNAGAEFLVRRSIDSHTPKHTELVFDRYDNREFLVHIYEKGDKDGVTVAEPSRIEARLEKQGKTPFEHTEEQP
jgi:hypothetical protein